MLKHQKGKKMRKFYSRILAVCMAGTLAMTPVLENGNIFPNNVVSVQAASNVDVSWYKDGEKEFVLNSAEQLRGLAQLVNGTEEKQPISFEGCTVKLSKDIDLNNINWTPIGDTASTPFKGIFDGQGYSISKLFISKEIPQEQSTVPEIYEGFFGYVEGSSPELKTSLKNINLKDVDISVTHEGGEPLRISSPYPGIGGLAGKSRNVDITNCTIEDEKIITEVGCTGGLVGTAISGNVTKCKVSADINSNSNILSESGLGGIAASILNGNAEFLTYKGTISGCEKYVAGIAGRISNGNISNCGTEKNTKIEVTSFQASTAGIVGYLSQTTEQKLEQCVNNAEISYTEEGTGGMSGGIACFPDSGAKGTIEKCINYGNVSGGTVAGIAPMKITSSNQTVELNYCANYGKITGKSNGTPNVGALVISGNSKKPAIVKNSYTLNEGLENPIASRNLRVGAVYANVIYANDGGKIPVSDSETIEGITGYSAAQFKDRTVVDALNTNDGVDEIVWYQNTDNPDLAFNMTVTTDINVPETLNVTLGKTMKLQASVTPEDATNKTLVYTSSDETVATVKEDGTVSGLKEGTADITVKAMDTGKEKTVKVTVKEAKEENPKPSDNTKPVQPSTQKKNPTTAVLKKGTKLTAGTSKFVVTGTNTVSYTGTKNKKASKITVPATVKAGKQVYKVTSIANNAFKNNKKLKTVVIGQNITTIGKKAFYGCKNLKKITVQSKVLKKVGAGALKGINKKAVIKVPSKKYKAYKKVFKAKGQAKTVTIKK